ncbi:hypothetical protein INR49_006881 [Caranx melampygus]|nr:hypothetical protein INR49_006881 [Caranx melampygus]
MSGKTETRSKVVSDRFQHPSTRSGRPQNKLRPDLTCGFACLMELGTRHLLCTRELDPCPVPSKQP